MVLMRNFMDLMETGGPVMIPIGILSAWMWVLIVFKADWIRRVGKASLSVGEALSCLSIGKAPASNEYCPKAGALSYFMMNHYDGKKKPVGEPDQMLFQAAVMRQTMILYRHIHAIMVLAAAAPLLGLLGTVNGMVETFRVIGIYGMGNAQAMASGIKEALITTQAGLLIAIPGLLIGQTMKKKVQVIHNDILIFHKAVTQWLEKEHRQCKD